MTREQFNRAVAINRRLEQLHFVKKELGESADHRLSYAYKGENDFYLCNESRMRCISSILDKHDKMIRQEIDDEMERLRKEIEEL